MTVLCLGEPLISLTPPPHTSLAVADDAHLSPAGAELNVALHLARLGVPVAYAGAVGDDPLGARLRALLTDEGVDCSQLLEGAGPTGIYFKEPGPPTRMLYYRAGSAGSEFAAVSPALLAQTDMVHLTGVTFAVRGAIARTAERLTSRDRTWRLSFDVNYRPAMWAPDEAGPVLLETAGSADIVFVGRDEADWVWGASGSEEIRALFSPSTELVIKDDSRDVEIWAGGQWYRSTPPTIEVTDPIGAGDAFAAAYLAARRGGADPVTAAGHGHRLAGHVVSHVGDQGVRDAEVYRELRA